MTVQFGNFTYDLQGGDLRRRGLSVRLTPQARALLRILLSSPLRAHSREEIYDELWRGRSSTGACRSLNKLVHLLRRALGVRARDNQSIATVRRFGYRVHPKLLQGNSDGSFSFDGEASLLIAVLPIQVPRPNCPELSYLGSRITSVLTDALSAFPGVRVLAERTVRDRLANCSEPWRMRVHAIICGELLEHFQETTLRIELIDVRDGVHLSSTEEELSLPFGIEWQRKFVGQILGKMRPALEKLCSQCGRGTNSRKSEACFCAEELSFWASRRGEREQR
jgi:DNA-binding winged helix-turn-helix (wHTH) protein